MKKTLKIAGAGAVALSLAVLPMFGAYADQTDTVQATIDSNCALTRASDDGGGSYSQIIANGALNSSVGTSKFGITCNDATGWKLQAVGAGTANHTTELYSSTVGSGIATGTATDGGASSWAFKVSGTGAASGYGSFHVIPSSATTVASGSGTVSSNVITVVYQVYVSSAQAAGTYSGTVSYTLSQGAA